LLPGVATTGLFLTHVLGRLSPARPLVEAMLALRDRFQSLRALSTCLAASCLQYWAPLAQARESYVRAQYLAREEGERFSQDFASVFPFYIDVLSGAHLPSVAQELSKPELQAVMASESQRVLDRVLFALTQNLAGDEQSSAIDRELAPLVQGPWGSATTTFLAGAMASFAGLHLGASAWVARTALATEPLWLASWGLSPSILFTLALCITLIDGLPTASGEQRSAWEEKLAFYSARLTLWAKSCPETFLHMHLLVEAGRARQAGEHDNAARLYDEAAEDARKNGFVHGEALGLRLAGEHRLSLGRIHLARAYLREAHDAYVRWGALGAAAQLRARHPDFFPAAESEAGERLDAHDQTRQTRTITTNKSSERRMNNHLDVASALRAAQALSGDRELDSLVGRMLGLLAENAGAERAVLSLVQGGVLHIKAQFIVTTEQVQSDLNEPLDGSMRLPVTLVQYVARSKEPVVLGQASNDSRFEEDPYLRSHRPESVLAVPLVHQGRLSGVMYLEHPRTENAFPKARVELMMLLASQAATAVENAQLYGNLEAKVQERTTALDKAIKELWSEMDLARKIQTVLLPSNPQIPGYEMAAAMHPAAQVGGDYYDVFHSGEQDWVLIGDVSGHGVPAGLCMMMIQTALRTAALTVERTQRPLPVPVPLTPRRLLALADEAVRTNLQQIGGKHYVTLTALCLDGGTVRYAGLHQDLLIYRAARQTVERIETRGVWLGVSEEDISELLQDDELSLEAEDVLLLYTDGYTEAKVAGRLLGVAGLAHVFTELCRKQLPCAALITGLLEALKPATVQDDVTLVALRRLGKFT
jgi:serine phosphatase RsbU (regulator of sigma subunit)